MTISTDKIAKWAKEAQEIAEKVRDDSTWAEGERAALLEKSAGCYAQAAQDLASAVEQLGKANTAGTEAIYAEGGAA